MPKKTKNFDPVAVRKQLLKKREELLDTENPVYKTSCIFRPRKYSPAGEFDIRIVGKDRLLEGYKSLFNHVESAKELGVETTWNGFTPTEWKNDMITRRKVLDQAENIRFIEATEAELKQYLTESQLRAIGIEGVMANIEKALEK